MKKLFTIILLSCVTGLSFGQVNEIGVLIGGSNLIGDVGNDYYIMPRDFSIGAVFKHNWNPRVALRGNYTYFGLSGDDDYSDNDFKQQLNRKFENSIHELAFGIEYNFLEFDVTEQETSYTPYILFQVAAFSYKSAKAVTPRGQVTDFKDNVSVTFPIGLGFKGRLNDKLNFAIESAIRFTFTDELDYSTDRFPILDFGGNGTDSYIFTGLSLTYTFGRPACYAPMVE